jgi:hypothetical protein
MSKHARDREVISESQFGVRMNALIHQTILIYLRAINEVTKPEKNLYMLSLDMVKAYDSVS